MIGRVWESFLHLAGDNLSLGQKNDQEAATEGRDWHVIAVGEVSVEVTHLGDLEANAVVAYVLEKVNQVVRLSLAAGRF